MDSAFFATDTIGYIELCLANLISTDNYPKLKEHLLRSLKFSNYYIANDIMKMVIEINPNVELKSIFEEADNLRYDDKEREVKQKQLIDKFILIAKRQ